MEGKIPAFRFVHTADIHLDSPLKSLALRDPALADLVGDATRRAVQRIVDLCLSEAVDALLVAGDMYDRDQTSMKTARFLAEQFRRLTEAGVRVFVIRGNHDHGARITSGLTLPDGVHLFGKQPGCEVVERKGGMPIAIHGLSFPSEKAPESLLPKFGKPRPDSVNIGMLHTSLGGSPGHSVYAPCTAAELRDVGFRYWALGHIHKRSVIEGATTIVMPGMPQGRDINEDGPKSVTLVTVADDGSLTLEERVVAGAVFQRVEADVSGVEDMREALDRVAGRVRDIGAGMAAENMIARVRIAGATPLAWRLRRDVDSVRDEIAQQLGAGRGLWIEMVETVARDVGSGGQATGAVAELSRLAAESVLPSEGYRKTSADIAADYLRRYAPTELRDMLGEDEPTVAAAISALAAEGVEDVLARLLAEDGDGSS